MKISHVIASMLLAIASSASAVTTTYIVTQSEVSTSATNPFNTDPDCGKPDGALGAPSGFGASSFTANVSQGGATQPDRYRALRLVFDTLFGRPVTVGEVAGLSFQTKKTVAYGAPSSIDWRASFYTKTQGNSGDFSWYRNRFQTDTYRTVANANAPANQWNTWATAAAQNAFRFYDYNRFGFSYEDIVWSEIISGPVTRGAATINYSGETVWFVDVVLGANNGGGTGTSQLDAIRIELTNGDIAILDLSGREEYVDPSYTAATPGWSQSRFASIQSATNAAAAGDTVHVAAGTYTEQLSLVSKTVTITGAGSGTVIKSPSVLTGYAVTGIPSFIPSAKPVIYVANSTATIEHLVVDGDMKGNGSSNYGFYGVLFANSAGTLLDLEVKNISNNPLDGLQHGVAVAVFNGDSNLRTFTMDSCYLHHFQKNGTVFKGDGLTLDIKNNRILGIGPTSLLAQNGLQISAGPTGSVTGNFISQIAYAPFPLSGAILHFGGNVTFAYNTIGSSDYGLYIANTAGATVSNNNFVANDYALYNDWPGSTAPPPSALVIANDNWWGAPTSPSISSGLNDPNFATEDVLVYGGSEKAFDQTFPVNTTLTTFLAVPATPNTVYLEPSTPSFYVKPTETCVVNLKVANLQQPVNGLQAFLGFSSTYFRSGTGEVSVAAGGGVWDQLIFTTWTAGGDLDIAVGVTLEDPPTGGTSANATTAVLVLTPTGTEGVTHVAFRSDRDPDPGLTGTTLLANATGGSVFPTKVDSANIIIDGTAPVVGTITATESQPYAGIANVKNGANVTVQGTVNITVPATDVLAGLANPPVLTLVNGAANATATLVDETPVGTFNYTWIVDATTVNGTWTVTATVTDKAGNVSAPTFTLVVNKNQITGQLELEDFTGTGTSPLHTRSVTFVASGGASIKTWTLPLTNVSGPTFSYTLLDVPANTGAVSAKNAWSLRRKLTTALNGNGQSALDFLGATKVLGGDLNNSNSVNVLDYSILKTNWFTTNAVGDINGDGAVGAADYNTMKRNWFFLGDAQ